MYTTLPACMWTYLDPLGKDEKGGEDEEEAIDKPGQNLSPHIPAKTSLLQPLSPTVNLKHTATGPLTPVQISQTVSVTATLYIRVPTICKLCSRLAFLDRNWGTQHYVVSSFVLMPDNMCLLVGCREKKCACRENIQSEGPRMTPPPHPPQWSHPQFQPTYP